MNYSTHPAEDLGPIGSKREGIIGLLVHWTMAFNLEGTPLGLLAVECWARDAAPHEDPSAGRSLLWMNRVKHFRL